MGTWIDTSFRPSHAPATPPRQADGDAMPEERVDALTKWLGEGVLAGKVQGVRPSKRLVDSPAVLTGIMSQSMRQLQRAVRSRDCLFLLLLLVLGPRESCFGSRFDGGSYAIPSSADDSEHRGGGSGQGCGRARKCVAILHSPVHWTRHVFPSYMSLSLPVKVMMCLTNHLPQPLVGT